MEPSEVFSIEFGGVAFDKHEISAGALAQSLLALEALSNVSAKKLYGSDASAELKVKGGPRTGSFIVDLVVQSFNTHPVETGAAVTTVALGVAGAIKQVVRLGVFLYGKAAKPVEEKTDSHEVLIRNEAGDVQSFNNCVVNIYNSTQTQIQLSRLTQTLDKEGAEQITICTEKDSSPCVITKKDRKYFNKEEGIVLTDNVSDVLLEVTLAAINGSSKGWRFSEGEDGAEFAAVVEDEDFLSAVKAKKYLWVNGVSILASVRTVQTKNVKTKTERTVLEVKEVVYPAEE